MTALAQSLANQAFMLSAEDRAFLANAILQSLENQPISYDSEWEQVVTKRMDEVKSGKVLLLGHEEFLKRTGR